MAAKVTKTQQVEDWWDGLSYAEQEKYAVGFKSHSSPTTAELTAAYDTAHAQQSAQPAGKASGDAGKADQQADVPREKQIGADAPRAQAVIDPDPQKPLTKAEIEQLEEDRKAARVKAVEEQVPLTDEAKKRMEEDKDLPSPSVQPATPGASATNPVLARNDVDVTKVAPTGNSVPLAEQQG